LVIATGNPFHPELRLPDCKYSRDTRFCLFSNWHPLSLLSTLYTNVPFYDIEKDPKKKLFVSNIIKLAHILGIRVIAEGVETEKEFYVCYDIGCNYIQGYFIQEPTLEVSLIKYYFEGIADFNKKDARRNRNDELLIQNKLDYVQPICYPRHSVAFLFEAFRSPETNNLVPVINSNQEPMGIIKEKDLKEYVYSPYGKDLIRNQRLGLTLLTFLTKTPVAEIRTEIEQILEICTLDKNCEAVIVTENGRYIGLLNMSALLNLINEKNLAIARDQNPLTKLPGNTIINAFLARVVPNGKVSQMFVYFDFDNFKPFNDKYGFRRGDRAILLFADMLKMLSHRHGMFVGHIGGDDFFSSVQFQNGQAKPFLEIIKSTLRKFREDVVNLYDDDDKRAGYIMDRNQEERWVRIPLLTVSAAVLIKDMEEEPFSIEELAQSMAKVKKKAKESIDKLSILYLGRRSGTAEREDPAPPTPSFSLNTEYYLRMSAG